ncbi:tRNA wybutosine-synthesizing protein 3 homolog [Biomphalaria glabrata]|uniref:tRNA wybutosine-synthesizing protein 3 homolog n=1 Tax=Biomphalaria glabrata TaxID=6526 RepID=A0A9W2ZPZ6_BIOGL|nr:tRNA wybutosine-synthesizing protein 3 homolog [Biomphalaria glabrata]XP_055876995.1 tRNA wybutosine-synthesizing protein 3 homolog [Biomphalaria glabrata]XP_055876996.1 tRNA wybutosine-synthesizing protein 3 homolog [Biomphalaria glabrata]XP_055876997.1 tRNA wybutosine-synthesizing protein 3 homolog [Biomphalaria glabrata]XP_055876998.1 tRNA wybutosine-synthesizing protein 3 homolog [Biomphalaria glabrata]XP_055876999.1 tRNA wybutosine-synthesizing protein 3 homolog [Biomphalaria glabrata]
MAFANQKIQRLLRADLSKKGSVDEPIVDLVEFINSLPHYFTTSSCSGRILIFENDLQADKKGCKWLYVSHTYVTLEEILTHLTAVPDEAVFKFEPFIMHVQCQTLEDAQKLHQAAVAAGFRNSGITIGGKGKIMMAVRSTHSLEAPLSSEGKLIVSQEYIKFLIECANKKMEENKNRIHRFFELVKTLSTKTESNKTLKTKCPVKKVKKVTHSEDGTKETETDLSLFVFDVS